MTDLPTIIYGLYEESYLSFYGDGRSYTRLLGTSTSQLELMERWNAMQKKQCIEYGYTHGSHFRHIDPPMLTLEEPLRYRANTGGGASGGTYTISIKPVEQWDEDK